MKPNFANVRCFVLDANLKAGRVTPCAPQLGVEPPNGTYGVTRPASFWWSRGQGVLAALGLLACSLTLPAQDAPARGAGGGQPAPAARGGGGARPIQPDGTNGFVAIFDGKTLNGWDGDPTFWRAEDGTIIGESTPEKRVAVNTFLIWRGGTTKDFELKLDYKLSPGANSGVQYRSTIVTNRVPWGMRGYQADVDAADRYSGQVYEEGGRTFLALRGSFMRIGGAAGGGNKLIGSLGDDAALKSFLKTNDWNSLHIIARGNTIIQSINGHVMSALIDEDEQGRAMEGLLGLQIHTGQPMKLEFRNILFKKL